MCVIAMQLLIKSNLSHRQCHQVILLYMNNIEIKLYFIVCNTCSFLLNS